jgi:hypothetical protein
VPLRLTASLKRTTKLKKGTPLPYDDGDGYQVLSSMIDARANKSKSELVSIFQRTAPAESLSAIRSQCSSSFPREFQVALEDFDKKTKTNFLDVTSPQDAFAGERLPGYLRRGNSYPANYADAVAIDKAPLPRAIGHFLSNFKNRGICLFNSGVAPILAMSLRPISSHEADTSSLSFGAVFCSAAWPQSGGTAVFRISRVAIPMG